MTQLKFALDTLSPDLPASGDDSDSPDTLQRFSAPFGALVWRPVLYSRNDVVYIAARAWRAHAKKADLLMLKAIKRKMTPEIITAATADLVRLLLMFRGHLRDHVVTAVPCGHSRRPDCFAKRIAEAVAHVLEVPMVEVFADRPMRGVSHPKEFRKIPPLAWKTRPARPVLVIDDVAASGWHIEESLLALRAGGCAAFAAVWIAGVVP